MAPAHLMQHQVSSSYSQWYNICVTPPDTINSGEQNLPSLNHWSYHKHTLKMSQTPTIPPPPPFFHCLACTHHWPTRNRLALPKRIGHHWPTKQKLALPKSWEKVETIWQMQSKEEKKDPFQTTPRPHLSGGDWEGTFNMIVLPWAITSFQEWPIPHFSVIPRSTIPPAIWIHTYINPSDCNCPTIWHQQQHIRENSTPFLLLHTTEYEISLLHLQQTERSHQTQLYFCFFQLPSSCAGCQAPPTDKNHDKNI